MDWYDTLPPAAIFRKLVSCAISSNKPKVGKTKLTDLQFCREAA
jgi:hypothetical protein